MVGEQVGRTSLGGGGTVVGEQVGRTSLGGALRWGAGRKHVAGGGALWWGSR